MLNVPHLAAAVINWMNYVSAVGRSYVINEGSIKIPLTEYLEVNSFKPNLEDPHPFFKQKRFDLNFKSNKNTDSYYFEFKYINDDSTRTLSERQRIFNDLMRLHFVKSQNTKCCFLICGMQEYFNISFQNLDINANYNLQSSQNRSNNKKFYTEWFDFLSDKEMIIDLKNKSDEYSDLYVEFEKKYKTPYEEKTKKTFIMPTSIKTKLVFLSEEQKATNIPNTYKIGIWEIL
jgi:hypothetical protein